MKRVFSSIKEHIHETEVNMQTDQIEQELNHIMAKADNNQVENGNGNGKQEYKDLDFEDKDEDEDNFEEDGD
eukprot:CAMPEP_0116900526 /NCGR_PEP_ID=MMETSP0467-20121206/8770_1 /TAXON_ID=283647 /ORGANISM="Mesodinium pulex, Strain SPMC105" /LENGTH=71 /DNA_ID=CAMNT_0004573785 /DNA_START=343 /DNA_END=558 /DNA_ORIENTATION=+